MKKETLKNEEFLEDEEILESKELKDDWKPVLIEEHEEEIGKLDKQTIELYSMQDEIMSLESKVAAMYRDMHKMIDNFNKK